MWQLMRMPCQVNHVRIKSARTMLQTLDFDLAQNRTFRLLAPLLFIFAPIGLDRIYHISNIHIINEANGGQTSPAPCPDHGKWRMKNFKVRLPRAPGPTLGPVGRRHFLHGARKATFQPPHHDNIIIFHLMVRVSIGARRSGALQTSNKADTCHQRLQLFPSPPAPSCPPGRPSIPQNNI